MLIVVFGATLPAVSTVLGAFMAGLALGSFCFGRWIDGVRRPLLVFACLEAGVGLFAFLFPHLLAATGWLAEAEWTGRHPSAFAAARFALAFGLLLIPTAAMGGDAAGDLEVGGAAFQPPRPRRRTAVRRHTPSALSPGSQGSPST